MRLKAGTLVASSDLTTGSGLRHLFDNSFITCFFLIPVFLNPNKTFIFYGNHVHSTHKTMYEQFFEYLQQPLLLEKMILNDQIR